MWNVESLIGRELPKGVDWDLLLDGYTMRGPAVGTTWDYGASTTVFGMPTIMSGLGRLYYLHDDGEDNLGLGRRNLDVPDNNRGQALARHRMEFPFGAALIGEIGYLSDRNFLEQYDENGPNGWDRGKDYESLLYLHQNIDNFTVSGIVQGRLNDFDNDTQWLPRGDLTVLGEPLLGGWFNWSTHTYAGIGHLLPAESPTDPADIFSPLPYFTDSSGAVAMTRHELDLPFNVGPGGAGAGGKAEGVAARRGSTVIAVIDEDLALGDPTKKDDWPRLTKEEKIAKLKAFFSKPAAAPPASSK